MQIEVTSRRFISNCPPLLRNFRHCLRKINRGFRPRFFCVARQQFSWLRQRRCELRFKGLHAGKCRTDGQRRSSMNHESKMKTARDFAPAQNLNPTADEDAELDARIFNEVQLLLAEKRTAMSILRT